MTRVADARLCARLGVEFIGLNLWERSPRRASLPDAMRIADALRSGDEACPRIVLVTVSPVQKWLEEVCGGLRPDYVQVHGVWAQGARFQGIPVIRAFPLGDESDLEPIAKWNTDPVLIDARVEGMHGGTGKTILPDLVAQVARPFLLAGGLTPLNVVAAVTRFHPWGVDVASGVENKPGLKDPDLVRAFVSAVRSVESVAQGDNHAV